ncbi:ATP-binding protein [Solibacillus merdavium]|uniref:histidine kinase n=1 Tax=Solibacillus merdavium TaxID=2762218 RepID=A0ABR8XSN7_9BACL|nr:ATP-binding protein [Solibacillus merdavium]MBD8034958.1 GHKL domain-containing protein [Solibacillus merdavium]
MESTQPRIKSMNLFLFMLLMAFFTAIGGEIKFIPFEDGPFRFGLGSIIFFFALLIRPLPIITTGLLTGMVVIIGRSLLDFLIYGQALSVQLLEHLPAGIFYITFALCFKLIALDELKKHPLILGLLGTLFEVISNMVEYILTELLLVSDQETLISFLLFIVVGLLRSFFVVGIYSIITMSEQQKQLKQLMTIHSELYVEALYLKKTMNQIEQLTANSYQLYKKLKTTEEKHAMEALYIAQEIHEVKKDHERIYAGLSKITNQNYPSKFLLTDILSFIVEANESYAKYLNKSISFTLICPDDFVIKKHIALFAILNNLMANAVEAIEKSGFVTLSVTVEKETTTFIVEDNGIGIEESLIPVIFDAGYTSKFNEQGQGSTGIGLSHTKTIVENLNGAIHVTSDTSTSFIVQIPSKNIQKEIL